ncbi:hypothetical protein WD019_13790 [Fictibacillus sp. Mic-4]|uniref:hypothetical protein n=1 Tax=Fictibacillus sp. Mic-4 TaxID=3132826 RepID=UPI003CED415B
MDKVRSGDELYEHLGKMSKENSVSQIYVPGKGKFAIVLQEEESPSILEEVESDPNLRQMIADSLESYREGTSMTTEEFLTSISPTDFKK